MKWIKVEPERNSSFFEINLSLWDEQKRKQFMYHIMTFCGVIVLFSMAVMALLKKDYILFISDFLFAFGLIYILYRVRKNETIEKLVIIIILFIMFFFLYLFLTWKAKGLSFFWFYSYPIVALFMLGCRKGLLFSLIFIALALSAYLGLNHYVRIPSYQNGFLIRTVFSYLLVTFLTYVFEKTRYDSQILLNKTMDDLRELAIKDGLTGLYNRRYLDEIWGLIQRESQKPDVQLAFIMTDIDNFKTYNDTYGHQKGDEVLKEVSRILKEQIRRKTDYVFRYGGEEFSLLLYGADKEKTHMICENIRQGIYNLNITHKKSSLNRVTISLGAVICPLKSGKDSKSIIKLADDALYQAKDKGRNCTIFNDSL
jgi:diguanylate cyclase (GGDEF)-like protein